ncbi:MAG: NAD(+) synthase [Polyangiaceae bacterium]|nr:NAD(+) synthase [Polyangiaceae bacterium]
MSRTEADAAHDASQRSGPFHAEALAIDAPAVAKSIEEAICAQVLGDLKKKGVVVGLSGGIDSSVVGALAARALGKERVLGLFMPERHSSDDALRQGQMLAGTFGINTIVEDIAPGLAALGCYERQVEAIRMVLPEYSDGYRFKLTLPSILESERLNVTYLTVLTPAGETKRVRLTPQAYLQMVAATNFKQRVRKMTEYYHADRLNYAVAGTPNRLEYDQGFFVKGGDGLADFKPIAHLYKTQVYALAAYLGVPEEIRKRAPTTDTFSLPQGQDEFYFALPYDKMDLCLLGYNQKAAPEQVGAVLGLTGEQIQRVYRDIEAKRRVAHYLHSPPHLVERVAH